MKTVFALTATARRHAEAKGLLTKIDAVVPDPSLARGDIVEFATATGFDAFMVHARRLRIAADGSQQLVFELDFPVRSRS